MKYRLLALLCFTCLLCACEPIPPTPAVGEIGETVVTDEYTYRVGEDGSLTILNYRGEDTEVTVPQIIGGRAVKHIGVSVFHGEQEITSVTLPSGLLSIGRTAFSECPKLTRVVLPDTLQSIGDSAFNRCDALCEINLPNSLLSLGSLAFFRCPALTEIALPASLQSFGARALDETGWLADQTGDHAVLGSYYVRYLGKGGHVTLPQGITEVVGGAFFLCETVERITVPEGVKTIGQASFYGCVALQRIDFPASLTAVGDECFVDCKKLTYSAPVGSWAEQYANSLKIPRFNDAL